MFDDETFVGMKAPACHPLHKYVKRCYTNKLKYSHNSVNNPEYPEWSKTKTAKSHANCIQFTIIGNYISKEFLECVEIANRFYKYNKNFAAPIKRGVTPIEWPSVYNDLKLRFGGFAFCLQSQVAVLIDDNFLGGDTELKEFLKQKFIYHVILDYDNRAVEEFAKRVKSSGRPQAYMHITIDGTYAGVLIFMLYADLLPTTCENFLRLCKLRKGGYSGTPVHRIVQDGWVQCGGYGLKGVDMACENYIVPHDRRGVLCMANDGRDKDNSTQFFVLLQPAEWMAHKYVAFGQLIAGEETLNKIEKVPTYIESPMSDIMIMDAGILNLECQGIMPTVGINEFLDSHIEDLVELGESFFRELMERVFIEIEFREVTKLHHRGEGGEEAMIHETKRFMKNKEDMQEELEKGNVQEQRNEEFDVEYYEPEEYIYQHVSVVSSNIGIKEKKPYYISLTDVTCSGDLDSIFDFKRYLKGYYCMESDLATKDDNKKEKLKSSPSTPSDNTNESTTISLDSDEEKEIRNYLRYNIDRVSFAGDVIKGIAQSTKKTFAERKDAKFTDLLTKLKLCTSSKFCPKKVSINDTNIGNKNDDRRKIKRRQTGFIRWDQYDSDDEATVKYDTKRKHKEVSIKTPEYADSAAKKIARRQTGLTGDYSNGGSRAPRQSVLTRLYENVAYDAEEPVPTLKEFKPSTGKKHNLLLTYSPLPNVKLTNSKERFNLTENNMEKGVFNHMMRVQHGLERKISVDFVKTIDQGPKPKNSIRCVEFARTRPSITISDYQLKNQVNNVGHNQN